MLVIVTLKEKVGTNENMILCMDFFYLDPMDILLCWSSVRSIIIYYLIKNFVSDLTDGLPNNPHLKCTLCAQRLEDTHFVQVTHVLVCFPCY